MSKRFITFLAILVILIPSIIVLTQEDHTPSFEISGGNLNNYPEGVLSLSVYDPLGQPIPGLEKDAFQFSGLCMGIADLVDVRDITNGELNFSTVLVIDTSTSMSGTPIQKAKEAANLFVDSIGENDLIALYSFDSSVVLEIDYTSDKDALHAAINAMDTGGVTTLYDAATTSIQKASESPTGRRSVLLLSDGAEYGAISKSLKEDALSLATDLGVPVYTIGLGFGADRSFLQQLSTGTNAIYVESPSPADLPEAYANFAALFRSQYEAVFNFTVDGDGSECSLIASADTLFGQTNSSSLRITLPQEIPAIRIPDGLLDGEINTAVYVQPELSATTDIQSMTASLGGTALEVDENRGFTIDPVNFTPGTQTLIITATTVTGKTGSAQFPVMISTLPAVLNILGDLVGEISEPVKITVGVEGQTTVSSVDFLLDGEIIATDNEAPFEFTLDPKDFPPGAHTFSVQATSEDVVSTSEEVQISIFAFPAEIELSQIPDLMNETPVQVSVTVNSQSDLKSLEYAFDGGPRQTIQDNTFEIDPNSLGDGQHLLEVFAANAAAQEGRVEHAFSIQLPTPEPTIDVTGTAIVEAQNATASAIAQATAFVNATSEAKSTLDTLDQATAAAQETTQAETTRDAEIQASRTEAAAENQTVTAVALETQNAQATLDAIPTEDPAHSESTAVAMANIQATSEAQSTSIAQSTLDALDNATADALATSAAKQEQATLDANATLEQATADANATVDAIAQEATDQANATLAAEQQATLDANATVDTQNTAVADAQGTLQSNLTLTANSANASATAEALSTQNAQATLDALPTGGPTLTPIGDLNEIDNPNPTAAPDIRIMLCVGGIVLLVIVGYIVGRRRSEP